MLRAQVIEACHSPLASGVVLARKQNGTVRVVVDLRKLNQITVENRDDVWLLPRIDECLRRCAGMPGRPFALFLWHAPLVGQHLLSLLSVSSTGLLCPWGHAALLHFSSQLRNF